MPDNGGFGPDPNGGSDAPVIRQGADGQYYQLGDDGQWHVIEGMPTPESKKPRVPVESQGSDFLTRLLAPGVAMGRRLGIQLPDYATGRRTNFLPSDDPAAAASINAARTRYLAASAGFGNVSLSDLNTLLAAGEISPADFRALMKTTGGGGGGGITAYESAQLARQAQQDKISSALAILRAVGDQQTQQDNRQQAMQQLIQSASAYSIDPSQQYFTGLGPSDPAVNLGLTPSLRTNPVTVSPRALLSNPYDEQVQAALAQLRGLSGIAA